MLMADTYLDSLIPKSLYWENFVAMQVEHLVHYRLFLDHCLTAKRISRVKSVTFKYLLVSMKANEYSTSFIVVMNLALIENQLPRV
jgi:hypothetical protein